MSQVPHSPAHSSEHRPAGRAGAASRSPRSRRSPALHLLGALLCSAALVGCGSQPRQDSPTHTGPVWGGTQQQQSQYGYVRDAYPAHLRGRARSLFTMPMFLGISLMQWASGLAASLAPRAGVEPFSAALLTMSALLLAGALAFWRLPRAVTPA